MEIRQDTVFLNDRGNLTLPAGIRRALGLKGRQQLLVEANDRGEIVLRPAITVPIEYYTEARIKEFASEEKAVAKWLKKKGLLKKSDKK
jgi:AbrB family looped-hinge helix DNA binding protein